MSKLDMSVFEEFQEACGYPDSLESFIYQLCEGDISHPNELEYPDCNGRDWKDESYQQEIEVYRTVYKTNQTKFFSEWDYEHLEQEGGGEGGSEYCYGVFKLKGKIYKAEYSYYSHQGHEYDYICDTIREVVPVQKTVTVYE